MMKDDQSKRSNVISLQLKQKIKKKPYAENIGTIHYTYSILKKKNQVFFLTNERLLILIGNRSIGYARCIPETTTLPFYHSQNIPPLKYELLLSAVDKVTTNSDHLLIYFHPESKMAPWEFVCDSSEIANQWKQVILEAIRAFSISDSNQPLTVTISQQPQNTFPQPVLNSPSQIPMTNPQAPSFNFVEKVAPIVLEQPKVTLSEGSPEPQNPIKSNLGNQNTFSFNNLHQIQNNFPQQAQTNFPQQAQTNFLQQNQSNFPQQAQTNFSQQAQTTFPQQAQSSVNMPANSAAIQNFIFNSSPINSIRTENNSPPKVDLLLKQKENQAYLLQQKVDVGPISGQFRPTTVQQPIASIDLLQKKQPQLIASKQKSEIKYSVAYPTDYNWDYQFAKGEAEYMVIQAFKKHVETLAKQIIEELSLQEPLRNYRPVEQTNQIYKYEVNGISFELSFLQLSEAHSFYNRSTVISSIHTKKARSQFKNTNYILQCTKNKGRFRVPLMMLVSYKGFQVMAKVGIHSAPQCTAPISTLKQEILQLEIDTRISRTVFEDEQNLKVVAADSKWFQKLNRANDKSQFAQLCFLTDIKYFLSPDFSQKQRQNLSANLRPELLQADSYEGFLFPGGNLSGTMSRSKASSSSKGGMNLLMELSNSLPERLASLVEELENLDCTFTNSKELSLLMHSQGINMRYLGSLVELSKRDWLRSMLLSEIVARSAKYILWFDLQESTLNSRVNSLQRAKQFQINQVVSWLNNIFGVGTESEALWNQVINQAQTSFKATVNRDNLNIGYLLQALQFHGGFQIKEASNRRNYFKTNGNFSQQDFIKFTTKSTVFDPSFTDHYAHLRTILADLSLQNYQYLSTFFNTDKGVPIQSHYFLNDLGEEIITYLSNWLSPQQASYLYSSLDKPTPSQHRYQLEVTAIKWELKAGNLQKAQLMRDKLVDHIHTWLGESHPILTEVFELFANFYVSCDKQFQNALVYAKSALVNQQKLLGPNHFKLADTYYAMAETQLHYSKRADALSSYKRAIQVLEINQQIESSAYLQAHLKISQVYLLQNAIQGAAHSAVLVLNESQKQNNSQSYLSAAELLGRCFQVSRHWEDYQRLLQQLASTVSLFSTSIAQFQRLLKVILVPALHKMKEASKNAPYALSSMIEDLPDLPIETNQAFYFLKAKVDSRSFPWTLLQELETIQSIIKEIETNSLAKRWRGFEQVKRQLRGADFLNQLQALNCLLGKNFLLGALQVL